MNFNVANLEKPALPGYVEAKRTSNLIAESHNWDDV